MFIIIYLYKKITQLNNSEIDRVALYCLDCTLRPRLTIRTTAHRRNEMKKKREVG